MNRDSIPPPLASPRSASSGGDSGGASTAAAAPKLIPASPHFGVQLVGVDMVVGADGRVLVVDVNHFSGTPGKIPGFVGALRELVESR